MSWRFGDHVSVRDKDKVCVVIGVHHSLAEGTVLMIKDGLSTFFTRAKNCTKIDEIKP